MLLFGLAKKVAVIEGMKSPITRRYAPPSPKGRGELKGTLSRQKRENC